MDTADQVVRPARPTLEQAIRAAAPALLDALRDAGVHRLELAFDAGSGVVSFTKHQSGTVEVEPSSH